MMPFSMGLLAILLFYALSPPMAGKSKISRRFRTRIHGYSKMKNRQSDVKTELLENVFYFKTRTAHFPMPHANQSPQKIEPQVSAGFDSGSIGIDAKSVNPE